jgi:anti-sigma factor RsiW
MSCKRWEPLYSSFLDGELSAWEEEALSQHAASCPSCRDALSSLRRVSDVLAVSVEPDPNFIARFRARRQAELEAAGVGFAWRWVAVRLAPLALAAIVVAAATVWSSQREEELRELEARELGIGLSMEYEQAAVSNPVLTIALEPFPEGRR